MSVVTSGHDVADARLHRLVGGLVGAGLRVEVLGLGDAADAPADVQRVLAVPRGGLAARAARAGRQPFQARGRVLVVLDPDLVGPALLRRTVRGGAVVADVHEDYLSLLADRSWARGAVGRAARAVAAVSTALAARADLTVVADDHVPPHAARRRLVVANLPAGGYLPAPSTPDPQPRALYVGDVRTSRGLWSMLAALEEAPGWTLDVVGPIAAAEADWLARWQASSPAAGRVRLHGRLPPPAAWALARGAWAGLCLLDDTPAFRAAVPTKLYEYLACGLPVLATPLPRLRALVAASDAGVLVSGPGEASATLRAWSAAPASLEPLRAGARAWAATVLPRSTAYDDFVSAVAALVGHHHEERE